MPLNFNCCNHLTPILWEGMSVTCFFYVVSVLSSVAIILLPFCGKVSRVLVFYVVSVLSSVAIILLPFCGKVSRVPVFLCC